MTTIRWRLTLAWAALCVVATGPLQAAEQHGAGNDRDFLVAAASGGMMEVELGRVAARQASSERVKQFGQRMVTDHGAANAELKKLAARKAIALPSRMTPEHETMAARLSSLKGAEFDRAYMKAMLEDHQGDVAEFRDKTMSATDDDVKAFATETLPKLEEHLRL
jgi:putative membrane protein